MIGIFDSGVGGMTVARAIEQLCPGYPLVYFGDIARTPYGSKSRETIRRYAVNNTEFLLDQGAKLIVIACNSAASAALDELTTRFSVPILDVINPAVRQAAHCSASGRIGVIGTRATIKSGVYEQALQQLRPDCTVHSQPCPLLVPLVEEGWLGKRETKMILRRYLHPLRRAQIDTLVLGCTHYPLLAPLIAPRIGRRVMLIDSSVEVARTVALFLDNHPELARELQETPRDSRFFVSDLTDTANVLAKKIFGRAITLEKVNV